MRVVVSVAGTARVMVLARLLAPEDFGLISIALLVVGFLDSMAQTGFATALVQRKGDIRPYLDTAWTVQLVRGVVLAGAVALAAPVVSRFFDSPGAESIVRTMALVVLFKGLTNSAVVYFQRDLEFRKQSVLQIVHTMSDVAVSVGFGIALRDVRALVYGAVAASIALVVVSFIVHPYRPRPRIDFGKARELYSYGKWVFGTNVLKYFILNGDNAFVGRMLGTVALGHYQMAYRISQMPATEVGDLISRIMFPAWSKMQEDVDRLRAAYLRTVQVSTLVTLPLAGGVLVLADAFTRVVLTEKWLEIVPALQVLAVLGALKTIGAFAPLFQALGRPRFVTIVSAVRLAAIAALIYPLTQTMGIVGTGWAVLIGTAVTIPWSLTEAMKAVRGSLMQFVEAVWIAIAATGVMMAILLVALQLTASSNIVWAGGLIGLEGAAESVAGLVWLGGLATVGCLAYGSACLALDTMTGSKALTSLKRLAGISH